MNSLEAINRAKIAKEFISQGVNMLENSNLRRYTRDLQEYDTLAYKIDTMLAELGNLINEVDANRKPQE